MTTYRISNPRYSFMIKGLVLALLITIADILFFQDIIAGASFGIFALAWTVGAGVVHRAIRRDRRAILALGMAAIFGVSMIVDPSVLGWILFWVAISMAVLLPSTAAFDDGWRWFQRLLIHMFVQYFRPLIDLGKYSGVKRRPKTMGLLSHWRVLVLPMTGSLIILVLFAQANPVIGNFLDSFSVPDIGMIDAWRIFIWLFLGVAIWASFRPWAVRNLFSTFDGTGDKTIAGVSVASVRLSLIMFNLIFAGQNALDIYYLWSGQGLPEGMSMTEYVHRGAYPLIVTALLAGLFVIVTMRPGSIMAKDRLIRRLLVLWIAQNVFLVFSSAERTLRYVADFMLTEWRIAALIWMGLVALGLLLICWRMFSGRKVSWLINSNLLALSLVLTGYAFVDTGATAAHWNIKHAREVGGKGTFLDLCYLSSLNQSSLLALTKLEQSDLDGNPRFKARVRRVRQDIMYGMMTEKNDNYWSWQHDRRLETAWSLLGKDAMKGFDRKLHGYSCDGRRIDYTASTPPEERRAAPRSDMTPSSEPLTKGRQQ